MFANSNFFDYLCSLIWKISVFYETYISFCIILATAVGKLRCDSYRYRSSRSGACRSNRSAPDCGSNSADNGLYRSGKYNRHVPAHAHYAYHYYRCDSSDPGYQSVFGSASRGCGFRAGELGRGVWDDPELERVHHIEPRPQSRRIYRLLARVGDHRGLQSRAAHPSCAGS